MKFDPVLSYIIDGLSERIDQTNDRRLRKARALIEDVAMGPPVRWWQWWRR